MGRRLQRMNGQKFIRIAIDGPAAAGKSTVAKQLARKLSFIYVDTGAMYRAITLKALRHHISVDDEEALSQLLKTTEIQLQYENHEQHVYLDGENVTDQIRSNEVSNAVSHIAKYPAIREEMVEIQRKLAENKNVIMDGRDIGTNVIPDAEIKIFLLASVKERAKRRYDENKAKGIPSDLQQLENEIAERDERDMNREFAPLTRAEDAIVIDTTSLTIEEVTNKILALVNNFRSNK